MEAEGGTEGDDEARDMRGWLRRRGFVGPRGPRQMAIRHVLYRMHANGEESFSLEGVMEAAGLDFNDRRDYTAAHTYVSNMRRVLVDFVEWFWQAPQYQEYVHDGLGEGAIFNLAVDAMVQHEIYPLYYNRMDRVYHFLTLPAFARILRFQSLGYRTGILRRVEELALMTPKFPMLGEIFTPSALPTDGRFLLPAPETRFPCPNCPTTWRDSESLEAHRQRRHPEAAT